MSPRITQSHLIRWITSLAMCFIITVILLTACYTSGYHSSTDYQLKLDTALLKAAQHSRDAEILSLLVKGANPNARMPKGTDASGFTPIILLSTHAHLKASTVRALQKAGGDINAISDVGLTALMGIAICGSLPPAKVVLDCGAKVDLVNKNGDTALMAAAFFGHDDFVAFLLKHGAKVNLQNHHGQTALEQSASIGNREGSAEAKMSYPKYVHIVSMLLNNGAKPNIALHSGYTPLMGAAFHGNTEIVAALLKFGADVNVRDNKGQTALKIATRNKHEAIVRLLKRAGAM